VFEKIFTKFNGYFWLSICFVCGFQFVMIELFPILWRTSSLNRSEWGACIVTGSTVLPVAFLLKRTGKKILNNIPGTKFVDEDND